MRRLLLATLLLAGCGSHPPPVDVGRTHGRFMGKPAYLDDAAPPRYASTGWPDGQVAGPRSLPTGERRDRLRALLAAVDAHSVSIDTLGDVRALQLTTDEIVQMVTAWPDIAAEAEELRQIAFTVAKLPATERLRSRERIVELTDLIRLQLLAGR